MQWRRTIEVILLAVCAIATVYLQRLMLEHYIALIFELAIIAVLGVITFRTSREFTPIGPDQRANKVRDVWNTKPVLFGIAMVLVPWFSLALTTLAGLKYPLEIILISSLATASLSIGLIPFISRSAGLSIVSSGFVVLFTVFISDVRIAVWVAIIWMLICLWHLVCNHWERLQGCSAQEVKVLPWVRPLSLIAACLLCVFGAWIGRNIAADSDPIKNGFMPTSGGDRWADDRSQSGVGRGEKAIAAKDHAESFGAVNSEIFLESKEPSLFDMFNDLIGEPDVPRKNKVRTQAIDGDRMVSNHGKAAKSEDSQNSFSIKRSKPEKTKGLESVIRDAILEWDGPTGMRLAVNRYDDYRNGKWTKTKDRSISRLKLCRIAEDTWYLRPSWVRKFTEPTDMLSVNLLRLIRLGGIHVPAPMGEIGVRIQDVDRPDFFSIDNDDSLCMPGREKIPALTVFHIASQSVLEDDIRDGLKSYASQTPPEMPQELHDLADRWRKSDEPNYEKLRALQAYFRNEFTFDRETDSSQQPIEEFLKSQRGGDHLFATAFALVAKQLGFETRLVTGFYIRPDAFQLATGTAGILPTDAHVWVEVQLKNGYWVEFEPTPGFVEPKFKMSWWLYAKTLFQEHWLTGAICAISVLALAWTRVFWLNKLLDIIWFLLQPFFQMFSSRTQIRVALWVVECRAWLAGKGRAPGQCQRDWLETLSLHNTELTKTTQRFCDMADRIFFGFGAQSDRSVVTNCVAAFSLKTLYGTIGVEELTRPSIESVQDGT